MVGLTYNFCHVTCLARGLNFLKIQRKKLNIFLNKSQFDQIVAHFLFKKNIESINFDLSVITKNFSANINVKWYSEELNNS